MRDLEVGRLLRMLRIRRGWRLRDVADRCGLSTATIGRTELGIISSAHILRQHAASLDLRVEWRVVGRGADVARVLDDEHAAIVNALAGTLRHSGVMLEAEASFSEYGERGRIDLLGFDPASETVLVVEVKTELADLQDLFGGLNIKTRQDPSRSNPGQAPQLARVADRHDAGGRGNGNESGDGTLARGAVRAIRATVAPRRAHLGRGWRAHAAVGSRLGSRATALAGWPATCPDAPGSDARTRRNRRSQPMSGPVPDGCARGVPVVGPWPAQFSPLEKLGRKADGPALAIEVLPTSGDVRPAGGLPARRSRSAACVAPERRSEFPHGEKWLMRAPRH